MMRTLILGSLLCVGVALKASYRQEDLNSDINEGPTASIEQSKVSSAIKALNDHDDDIDDFDDLWTPDVKERAKGNDQKFHELLEPMDNGTISIVGGQPAVIDAVDDFGDLWTEGIEERAGKEKHAIYHSTAMHGTVFIGIIVLGILFEVYVLQKGSFNKDLSIKDALVVLGSWLGASLLFLLYVGAGWGLDGISTWLDGYLLEMMLSVDNLFVFVLIMGSFHVPAQARSKVLMIGVLAALLLRIVMFGTIWLVISWAEFVSKALGAFIIYCAYKVVMLDEDDDEEITENAAVKMLSTYVPMTTDRDESGSFFIKGKATTVFLAAGAMIFLDVIFAVDSVSAKTALIADQYLSYTSTGFCMFALRATYYLLDAAKDMFEHLKYGISIILALIGLKTMLPNMLFIADWQYLLLLLTILGACVATSMIAKANEPPEDDDDLLKESEKDDAGEKPEPTKV